MKLDKHKQLFMEISQYISQAKADAVSAINVELTILNWKIGQRIKQDILKEKRGTYGKQLIEKLSLYLTQEYGRGWSSQQLRHCIQFYTIFDTEEKLYTVCRELTWSHLRALIYIEDQLKRDFYIELIKLEKWSIRRFQERMKSMLYERTALSKLPEKTIEEELKQLRAHKEVSQNIIFKAPYLLDFLGLLDTYSEKDLETAILNELQHFLIELGADFAFLARQKRIVIDQRDYYIDLLFYHRRLKSLVAIDLKIGEFDAAYKGQMELYLRYLEKYEQLEGEHTPIGLILCTGKNEEHIELLQLDKSNIRVAEYLTKLPATEVLKDRLHRAIALAKNKIKKNGK